ncbi:MAG TPA: HAMP domain-containing sensor histidine kinase, partial [Ideonella sp.]|nr:HAMP domain-containing sensor histidine kinase [Ideonella sp.]
EATEAQKRLLESFVGIASHDLRNPLNTIIVSVTLLERMPQLVAELQPVARRIRRGAERALRLVRDLLDFTQVRLGRRLPIDPAPTDLAAVAREVVDELRAAHPARCIELQVEADALGVWDADRMAQVLANLLGNALAHGDPAAPVVLHVGGDADAVELAVHNQGPPIPEALRARLFEPLQQGERRGRGAHGGIGLGLFIVEQIVRAHRGSVGVESTAQGTTFRVRLPRGVE